MGAVARYDTSDSGRQRTWPAPIFSFLRRSSVLARPLFHGPDFCGNADTSDPNTRANPTAYADADRSAHADANCSTYADPDATTDAGPGRRRTDD